MADERDAEDEGLTPGQPPLMNAPPAPDEDETDEEADEAPAVPAQENANVALAGRARPVTVDGPVNVGLDVTINLPSEAQQRAGFHLKPKEARMLLQLYPMVYKRFEAKGGGPRTGQQQNGGEQA